MSDNINFSHFTSVKNSFESNPGLCNLFKFLAIETWKRIEFTYLKAGIKIYETTLTQNIAFTINAYKNEFPGLTIEIWETDNEKANGNDLELLITFSKHKYDFYAPVQAKKIYRNDQYTALGKHDDQIEKLIKYARDRNGYPLYLLYNYVDNIPPTLNPDNELYGCSIVDAFHLHDNYYNKRLKKTKSGSFEKAWNIPSFKNLHPKHAFPWHELVCNIDSPKALFEKISKISDPLKRLEFKPIDNFSTPENTVGLVTKQALSYDGWYKSTDKEIIKDIPRSLQTIKNQVSTIFQPQTRIVINI